VVVVGQVFQSTIPLIFCVWQKVSNKMELRISFMIYSVSRIKTRSLFKINERTEVEKRLKLSVKHNKNIFKQTINEPASQMIFQAVQFFVMTFFLLTL
jgi:hypothetical protein